MINKLLLTLSLVLLSTASQAQTRIRVPTPGISAPLSESGPAQLTAIPTALNFGVLEVEQMPSGGVEADVVFKNTGKSPITFESVLVSVTEGDAQATLNIGSNTCVGVLAKGASCTVRVSYSSAGLQAMAGTLYLAHNGPGGETRVPVSGQPAIFEMTMVEPTQGTGLNVWAPVLHYGRISSHVRERAIRITNTSPHLNFSVSGGPPEFGDFELDGNTCGSTVLAQGDSCLLTYRVKPGVTIVSTGQGYRGVIPMFITSSSGKTVRRTMVTAQLWE